MSDLKELLQKELCNSKYRQYITREDIRNMNENIKHRTDCRLCHKTSLSKILNLGQSTLANENVSDQSQQQESYPLELWQCEDCGLFQLLDIVNPELMFKEYQYLSGTSKLLRDHFQNYNNSVINFLKLESGQLVVDIGSNDATLLKEFKNNGLKVIGVEPATNLANKTNQEGILTINDFFNVDVAKSIVNTHGKADVITCNNCLAHLDNIDEIILGVKELLAEDGTFIFENAYFSDSLKTNDFSQIYHEHLCYFTIEPLVTYFDSHDMTLYHVEKQDIHGGSIRVFVKKGAATINQSVSNILQIECKFLTAETWKNFENNVKQTKTIKNKLLELKAQGKTICGATASAKSTTFLHYTDIGNDILDCVFEGAIDKIGKFTSGTKIPIVSFDEMITRNPDYIIILSYNFAKFIMEKYKDYKGTWITCFPVYKECKNAPLS